MIAASLTLQADGKIVIAGYATLAGNEDFGIARLNVDGTLDSSFGTSGRVTTAFGSGADRARSVTLQADGRIVVVGQAVMGNLDIAIARYNSDGSLDTAFSGDGRLTLAIGAGYDTAGSVAIQPDGKILLAGDSLIAGTADFTVVRLLSDGSLDATFGTGGIVTTAVLASSDYSKDLILQPDGKIVVVGETFNGSNNDIALVRYNTDGSLDTTFGAGGKVVTPIGSSTDAGSSVTLDAQGRILVAGNATFGSGDSVIVRYNADGSLDTTFGASSTLGATISYTENGSPVVLDANVSITDAELSAADNFNGATLTLARNGGASVEDIFSATGTLSFTGSNVFISGSNIGSFTNIAGTLSITFNADATGAIVNAVMRQIATPTPAMPLQPAFRSTGRSMMATRARKVPAEP
jgi:uncharacterized delta-60 repeat protein